MNFMFWNSRGTGAKSFPGLIRELSKKHNLDFLAILETRLSGDKARKISHKLGFSNVEIIDAQGFSGGIWVLWNDDAWQFEVLGTNEQFIHLCLDNRSSRSFFTAVYASPNPIKRRLAWGALKDISSTVNGPWCIGGDFNGTLKMHDRRSMTSTGTFIDRDFSCWVEELSLLDLGCNGPYFTWRRGNSESRIDRILVNNDFFNVYHDASVLHLPFFKSDHRPLLLRLGEEGRQIHRRDFPFRFLASWVLHDNFSQFVKEAWHEDWAWNENLTQFTSRLKNWSHDVYGFLGRRKRHLLNRLEGLNNFSHRCYNNHSRDLLLKRLWQELEEVIIQEDLNWAQKAKCDWYIMGDKNSKYFHARVNARRRRNKIEAIQNDMGEWISDHEEIKNIALTFYKNLFQEDGGFNGENSSMISYPPMDLTLMDGLGGVATREEIR